MGFTDERENMSEEREGLTDEVEAHGLMDAPSTDAPTLDHEGEGARLRLELPGGLLRYCVEKGSLTVDGVALTVAALGGDGIEVALVPFTLQHTTLAALQVGDEVNVEVDLLAKYAERLASP